jgi:hypothetical protein
MFFIYCGSTPPDELYGIIDFEIDPDHGLHEPIGVHEASPFNFKKYILM